MSQIVLGGDASGAPPDAPMWKQPFMFHFENGKCFASARNFTVILPVSRDLRLPIGRQIRFLPSNYRMRPDYTAVFD